MPIEMICFSNRCLYVYVSCTCSKCI